MTIDEEYDAIESAEIIEEQEKKLAIVREKRYNEFIQNVELSMRNRETRHFIREIFKWCGFYNATGPEEEKALHAEGRRLVGSQLKNVLDQIDPKLYHQIMIEGVDYEKALYSDR